MSETFVFLRAKNCMKQMRNVVLRKKIETVGLNFPVRYILKSLTIEECYNTCFEFSLFTCCTENIARNFSSITFLFFHILVRF